jgi:hypothetical protein
MPLMLAAPVLSATLVLAAAPLWAPPSSSSSGVTPAGLGSPAPRRARKRPPAAVPVERAAPSERAAAAAPRKGSTEALEAEVFGNEAPATPQARRAPPARARDEQEESDDEEDDDGERRGRGAPIDLPPVITPHLIAFGLGPSLMGRSFSYDAPLQPESSFPRGGVAATLESYPLLRARGWFARFGVGASFGTEIGDAGIGQADGGTLSYKVSERRWEIDLRYALPLAQRFLLVPRFGYGRSSYDLDRRVQPAPSACTPTNMQVCLPDVSVSHVALGFDARFAAKPWLAVTLGAALLPAFGVARGMGQLGAEAAPSAIGFSTELGVSWQLLDWLAVRAAVPMVRYSYAFSAPALTYKAASETYYGISAGAVVFAR